MRVADFDGDGLLDFVPGRYWERTQWGEQPRVYGRMYKNIGTPTAPKFEARDATNGAPYTERFQTPMPSARTASGRWTGTTTARRT